MERKVIKFSLVGFIMTVILIIAAIVGIIIYFPKIKSMISNKDNKNLKDSTAEQSNSDKEIDEEKQYNETIVINDNTQEIAMKKCKGSFGYSVKYDFNAFYVEKDAEGIDKFNSLYSNTVFVYISEKEENYDENVKKLLNNNINNINDKSVIKYNVSETEINGRYCIKEEKVNSYGESNIYYIKKDDNDYYIIQATSGQNFSNEMLPRINKMIETFEIL